MILNMKDQNLETRLKIAKRILSESRTRRMPRSVWVIGNKVRTAPAEGPQFERLVRDYGAYGFVGVFSGAYPPEDLADALHIAAKEVA